ncbi:MAG: hypothetical protein KAU20_03420, partial [Nanoarchaeota archaeon]|nr:hypothetical protein [Nanoarchaeota archaeon]
NDLLLYYTPPEVNSDFYARGGKFYYNPYFIIGVILVIILLDLFIFIIPAYIRTKGNRGGKFFKTVIRSSQHKKEIEEKSKLRDYIAKYLGQGYNIQQIRQSLINQGYNPNEIDKTISESNSIK